MRKCELHRPPHSAIPSDLLLRKYKFEKRANKNWCCRKIQIWLKYVPNKRPSDQPQRLTAYILRERPRYFQSRITWCIIKNRIFWSSKEYEKNCTTYTMGIHSWNCLLSTSSFSTTRERWVITPTTEMIVSNISTNSFQSCYDWLL
jgi:hypothetical protein